MTWQAQRSPWIYVYVLICPWCMLVEAAVFSLYMSMFVLVCARCSYILTEMCLTGAMSFTKENPISYRRSTTYVTERDSIVKYIIMVCIWYRLNLINKFCVLFCTLNIVSFCLHSACVFYPVAYRCILALWQLGHASPFFPRRLKSRSLHHITQSSLLNLMQDNKTKSHEFNTYN